MDEVTEFTRQYLTWWLALVIAPVLLMIVLPSSRESMVRLVKVITKVWFLPVTWTVRRIIRWYQK